MSDQKQFTDSSPIINKTKVDVANIFFYSINCIGPSITQQSPFQIPNLFSVKEPIQKTE